MEQTHLMGGEMVSLVLKAQELNTQNRVLFCDYYYYYRMYHGANSFDGGRNGIPGVESSRA